MDLSDTAELADFRSALRKWLATHVPGDPEPSGVSQRFWWRHAWHISLYDGGWLGLDWPAEYGGAGRTRMHLLVLTEELTAFSAPPIANWVGLELVGPTLLQCGSPEQRARFLPSLLDGSHVWCQAFSEERAGSDLAAVETAATAQDGGYVLDGHKTWSSWAQFADYALVLARSGPAAERHRSLSCFVVPLDTPGVTVTPIRMLYGDAEECSIELDRVQLPADSLVGAWNGGWKVLMTSLSLARGMSTVTRTATLRSQFTKLVRERIHRSPGGELAEPEQATLTEYHARLESLRYLAYRKVGELEQDGVPGPIASTEKLLWGELSRQIAQHAVDVSGPDALIEPDDGVAVGWLRELFRALGNEIEGGTSEIQRTTIARHVLGLPA